MKAYVLLRVEDLARHKLIELLWWLDSLLRYELRRKALCV